MQAFFLAPAMLALARDAEAAGILTAVCCCYGTPILLSLVLNILMIAGQWAAFDKAGQPGWAAIIPIYNLIVWAEIAKKEAWWGLLLMVPIANLVFMFMLNIEVAKQFGKDVGYGVGLTLLPFVFWPMLGFGKSRYGGNAYVPVRQPPSGGGGGPWGQPPKQGW